MSRIATTPRFLGQGKIDFAEHRYDEPASGQLLLAVQANAICGTDRAQYSAGSDVTPGHEVAGTVLASGPGTQTSAGTRGVVFLMEFCGDCRSCRLGATNQCLDKRADVGFTTDGGYGRYVLVAESSFFPITDDLEIGCATLLLDLMGTSGHALRRAQLVRPDIESVYIAGAGPIGLGLVIMSRLRFGPDVPVYVSDISAWRLDFAETFGGVPVLVTQPGALAKFGPFDVAFDSTGKEVARRVALDLVGQRGALVCVGHGEGLPLVVSPDLLQPERAVLGSEYFRHDELAENLELLRAHSSTLSRVITHRFGVDRIADAFELFLSGRSGKILVVQED